MDIEQVRRDFPVLSRKVAGRSIVYFDNAATSLKPRIVADRVVHYLTVSTANIHRGKHLLAQEASVAFEETRTKVAHFLNCRSSEVIFVRGATEGINLVASGLRLTGGDNVVGTLLEHHSNVLPWVQRCEYRAAPLDASGLPDVRAAEGLIDRHTRLLTVTHCSNATGIYVPLEPWRELAERHGLPLLVDAAQSGAHRVLDVQQIGCDFLVLSGHKMCGPTGAGVLYGKVERLEELEPPGLGGGAVNSVAADYTYEVRELPWRLESGTPDIAAVIGLGAAIDYIEATGLDRIARHLDTLRDALDEHVHSIEGFSIKSAAPGLDRACIVSLVETSGTMTPDFLSRILSDTYGIMSRAGHHCAHPLHEALGTGATLRVSLHFYNTLEEVEHLRSALESCVNMIGKK